MKKVFTLTLALMASFSLWAADYVGISDTTVHLGSYSANPGSGKRFSKYCNGLYLYRANTGSHSMSSGTADNKGIKLQNTYSGIVVCLTSTQNITTILDYNATSDYPSPYIRLMSITETTYEKIFKGTDNSTSVDLDTTKIEDKTITFTKKGLDSVAFESVEAGFYYIYARTPSSNTYFTKVKFESANATPSFTAPTNDENINYEKDATADALEVTVAGYPTPSLQWYSNTTKSTEGATVITGETNATYTPSTAATGDFYYYCVATNTLGSATSYFFHVNVDEAICPSGISISGENEVEERDELELTAALTAGNGTISYQWYKDGIDVGNAIEGETSETLTIASCELSDAGNYYCIASKDGCEDAVSEAYAVTVIEMQACYSFVPKVVEENESISANAVIETSDGGKMTASEGTTSGYLTYTPNGLLFGSSSNAKVNIVLSNYMKVGTVIKATLWSNETKAGRTLKLNTASGTNKDSWNATATEEEAAAGGAEKEFTYTVVADDGLAGTNALQLQRSGNVYLRSLSVAACGEEVPTPPTAIDNTEDEVKAVKVLRDGQLFIEKNGHVYNVFGACIK